MREQKSEPLRSCVVCRKREQKRLLQRFVVKTVVEDSSAQEKLLIDPDATQVKEGRGFYCHLTAGCLGHKKFEQILYQAAVRGSTEASSRESSRLERKRWKELGELIIQDLADALAGNRHSEGMTKQLNSKLETVKKIFREQPLGPERNGPGVLGSKKKGIVRL